jgi:hypothetical protein
LGVTTRVGPAQSPDVLFGFVGDRLTYGAVIFDHDGDQVCAGLVGPGLPKLRRAAK